jgi:hypothetical protein
MMIEMIASVLWMLIGLLGTVKVLGMSKPEWTPEARFDCLPTGKDALATDEEIIEALNEVTETMKITSSDVDGLTWNLDWLKTFQNNAHHLEGWLYNHVILMLLTLRLCFKDKLNEKEYMILERAIFWSDLGKYHTTKAGKKLWEDGTPMSTAFGHDKKSAELLDEAVAHMNEYQLLIHEAMSINYNGARISFWLQEAYDWYTPVRWLVMEHMNAHKLEEMDAAGKTAIPDFLKPIVQGLEPWAWPEWEELEIPHEVSLSKKNYAWIVRGNSKLLRIKQMCDSTGRLSDLDF